MFLGIRKLYLFKIQNGRRNFPNSANPRAQSGDVTT
jgi:hypothetical protein